MVRGIDDGEFGDLPLTLAKAESERFGTPITWFIDAAALNGVQPAALALWSGWLARHARLFEAIHVTASSAAMSLNLSVAKHLAPVRPLVVHESFGNFLEAAALTECAITADTARFDEPAITLTRTRDAQRGWVLGAPDLEYTFHTPSRGVIVTTAAGEENGALCNDVFDRFDGLLDEARMQVHWFLDLRGIRSVAPAQASCWSAWLTTRQARFASITVLAPAPVIALFVLGTKFRLRANDVLRIIRTELEFFAALDAAQATIPENVRRGSS
jgi:hypothetical protein